MKVLDESKLIVQLDEGDLTVLKIALREAEATTEGYSCMAASIDPDESDLYEEVSAHCAKLREQLSEIPRG